jgi:hypothetical protein
MHTRPADQRRREKARRRTQIARRRVVALVVVVTLITVAVWVAYAIPGQTPAQVPAAAAEPTFGADVTTVSSVVVAQAGSVDVLLPVAQQVTTAIAFHAVDNPDAVAFTPVGDRLGGGDLGQKLADIFAGGGGVKYYLMAADSRLPRRVWTSAPSRDLRSSPQWTGRSPPSSGIRSSAVTRTSRSTSSWRTIRRCFFS